MEDLDLFADEAAEAKGRGSVAGRFIQGFAADVQASGRVSRFLRHRHDADTRWAHASMSMPRRPLALTTAHPAGVWQDHPSTASHPAAACGGDAGLPSGGCACAWPSQVPQGKNTGKAGGCVRAQAKQ